MKHLSGSPPYCRLLALTKTLDKFGKACHGKHSSILRTIINYGRKKFYNIGLWGTDINSIKLWHALFSKQASLF
jgi:hypothetical protein